MSYAQQAIATLDQTINSFKSRVDVKVNGVATSTSHIQATTDRIYQNIEKFKTDLVHGEESQIAQENIIRIDQIIKEQFSGYISIRRTVMGIVRDFDINLVRNSTIQELSEELWITSSRYWLSYALIALTAWVNDYPDLARNALSECVRRDPPKSTLFFCLMNLRFARIEAAKLWFFEYIRTLDPTHLRRETAVLLQAYLGGIFGNDKELEDNVVSIIEEWIRLLSENEEASNSLQKAYEDYISSMTVNATFSYPAMAKYCTTSSETQTALRESSKFQPLIDLVASLDVREQERTPENYKSRVDVILNDLISSYDTEELELKRQQEYFRCIVETGGVVEQAEEQYRQRQELENADFNIGAQMLRWAIYDDSDTTNVTVRRFGMQNTKTWFKSAIEAFDARLAMLIPTSYHLRIDTWEGISNGNDLESQAEALKNHFENNKFQNMFVNTPNIVAAILFVAACGLAFVTLFSLIVAAVAGAFLGYRIFKALKEYPLRVRAATDALNAVMTEITESNRAIADERAKKDALISAIDFL